MNDAFDLERFVVAQHGIYGGVLDELHAGHKQNHWIWFIFPQMAGLGSSGMSKKYAIGSVQEAEAYLKHPVLGPRLKECTQIVVDLVGTTAEQIFGDLDALKFRSSMTLFSRIEFADHIFRQAIEKYFAGVPDPKTLKHFA